jgi:chemotaxis protein methyltransferase CheR
MDAAHKRTIQTEPYSLYGNGSRVAVSGKYTDVMTDEHFWRLSEFIQDLCGIKLPHAKKSMLEGRLRKRLRALCINSFEDYCKYVFSPKGSESEYVHMIDVVTTNKTDFFREPDHFDYLSGKVLPELVSTQAFRARRGINVWSAACSTGEEPYTLAMVLSEFAEKCTGFCFSILATDISTSVLQMARTATYESDRADPIPLTLRRKYLLRSKDKDKGLVRIVPELRALVRFQRLNLMDEDYAITDPMGIVFCRNVLIYFDRQTQEGLLNRLSRHIVSGGFLFVGHSESLHGLDLPLVQSAPTIYRKL